VADEGHHLDADVAVRNALPALTDRERAVVVLRILGGLDERSVAHALHRPTWTVRRDLDRALSFLGEVAGANAPDEDPAVVRHALSNAAYPQSAVDRVLARLSAGLLERPPKAPPRRTMLAAAVAVVVAIGAGYTQLHQSGPGINSAGQRTNRPVEPSRIERPEASPWLKIVGFKAVMVTVPETWKQAARNCARVRGSTVVYPIWGRPAPCDDVPGGHSTVSFGYASELHRPDLNRSLDEAGADRVGVTGVRRQDGMFVQSAVLIDADVAVTVRSSSRRELAAIVSSIAPMPPGYVVMPDCLDLDPTKAEAILADRDLTPHVFADPSIAGLGLPLHVVAQNPPVGTLLPFDSDVNLGVVPR
jgi:hypothetical protein